MASTESTKEHTLFTPFAVTPGQERWQGFEEKRFAHGGRADDHGWSYTDVFRGVDDGGAAPGATALGLHCPRCVDVCEENDPPVQGYFCGVVFYSFLIKYHRVKIRVIFNTTSWGFGRASS